MGVLEDWTRVTTLPNILRVFNPYLAGGSTNTGDEKTKGNNLNLARYGKLLQ